ncbi:MAG: tetratricopeptide repeat protein [Sedimentisphaerales bacterium]|nr:tetratricopeptide repeat protein [Sedimentisphaerales bacterium]
MTYIPKLKYVFVQTRVHQIDFHMPLLRYLNKLGIIPPVLAACKDVIRTLMDNNISFDHLRGLPKDYDIMISLAGSFLPFGRNCLEKSAKAGKFNVYVGQLPVPFRYEVEGLSTAGTKFFHAMCISDQRTIDNIKLFNNEVVCLNTGHPAWDLFSTEQFQREVTDIKRRYGNKLLVVTVNNETKEEFLHCQQAIYYGESQGFTVILQVHPGYQFKVPEQFVKYVNPGINRYALFAAASHVIASILSSVVPECLYLGTKVSCKPFGIKGGIWGRWSWYNKPDEWYQDILPFYGKEYLDMIPLTHDENSMKHFLSSDERTYTKEDVNRIFGWPEVDNFTENIFQTIETHFGEHKNIQAALVKSRAWRGINEYFGWRCEIPNSPIKHITDPTALLKGGINALNHGDINTAISFLRYAEKFSSFDKFELIQFALATCYHSANQCKEAQKYIYRALAINPDCIEYQNLKKRIEAVAL